MASMPPFKMGGPPPGTTPQGLSNITGRGPQGDPNPQGGGGGVAKIFYAVEQALDQIASALPNSAGEVDQIKTQLREVLAKAVSGGAPFSAGPKPEGLASPAVPEGM